MKEKPLPLEYYSQTHFKRRTHVARKSKLPLNKKLNFNDIFVWNQKHVRIDYMIENNPVDLWKIIHIKKAGQTRISLLERPYKSLKLQIMKLKPELIEEVESKRKQKIAKNKLKEELDKDILNSPKSRFKSLNSREIKK